MAPLSSNSMDFLTVRDFKREDEGKVDLHLVAIVTCR